MKLYYKPEVLQAITLYLLNLRNGEGAIQCNTFFAGHNLDANGAPIQYGGTNGKGSYGCPVGFVGVGFLCFKFPIQEPANGKEEMAEGCKNLGNSIPYAPINLIQNTIMKGVANVAV